MNYIAKCEKCKYTYKADNTTELPDECPECCGEGHLRDEYTCPSCDSCIKCVSKGRYEGCSNCR